AGEHEFGDPAEPPLVVLNAWFTTADTGHIRHHGLLRAANDRQPRFELLIQLLAQDLGCDQLLTHTDLTEWLSGFAACNQQTREISRFDEMARHEPSSEQLARVRRSHAARAPIAEKQPTARALHIDAHYPCQALHCREK